MEFFQKEFVKFMNEMSNRLRILHFNLEKYPIDHVAFRVSTKEEYIKDFKTIKSLSVLYTSKFFHERQFNCFVLKEPLV